MDRADEATAMAVLLKKYGINVYPRFASCNWSMGYANEHVDGGEKVNNRPNLFRDSAGECVLRFVPKVMETEEDFSVMSIPAKEQSEFVHKHVSLYSRSVECHSIHASLLTYSCAVHVMYTVYCCGSEQSR
jgi:hypothetical protein